MAEIWTDILTRADTRGAELLSADDTATWPAGVLDLLVKLGVLREAEPATSVVCRECAEGCWIEPRIQDDPRTGKVIGRYRCPRPEGVGPFTVDLARMRQWEFHLAGLAAATAKALKLPDTVAELAPGRACFLGNAKAGQTVHELFLFRGMTWPDAAGVIAGADRYQGAAHPIVLVPAKVPPLAIWGTRRPIVRVLLETATLTARNLQVDLGEVVGAAEAEKLITVTEAAKLLAKDLSISVAKAKGLVSINADRGKFQTNGLKGRDRRIEFHSFSTWRLAKRDLGLDAEDADEDD